MYIAHFDHKAKNKTPHFLDEHVDEMLKLVDLFLLKFDDYNLTKAGATLHDVGKKSEKFYAYVQNPNGKRGSVKHAKGGAYLLAKQKGQVGAVKNYLLELLANIVAGHHAGLYDHDKTFFDEITKLPDELSQIEQLGKKELENAVAMIDDTRLQHIWTQARKEKFPLYISILVRLVMSALVDADYLSTEAYFSKEKQEMRQYEPLPFIKYQDLLEAHIEENFNQSESFLDHTKKKIQVESFEAGRMKSSFFSLHAPTGLGKTIASLRFALEHAVHYNKSRIITALPLTNLTEETSTIYKTIFGTNEVIEDHSNISFSDQDDGPIRLAAENWNRSFVVTTTVQLFESLLNYRPMKLRKLHRIANSIIILDEYHKLPLHVLEPILQHLDILQTHFNVTVLFMSATPFPLLESQEISKMNLTNLPIEITNYKSLFEKVPPHVKYEWDDRELSIEELAEKLAKETSVLTIVNTRKEAQTLHKLLSDKNHSFESVYYLTTTMCGAHRKQIIDEIRRKRNSSNPKNIAVISSSILEAGVDISFPTVYRMIAPLESIVQAAGRCNRYGEIQQGRIVLFQLKDSEFVGTSYRAGIQHTLKLLREKGTNRFMEPKSFLTYYQRVFVGKNLNELNLTHETCLKFRSNSKAFQMIEDNRIAVICTGYKGFKNGWLYETKSSEWWRKIQPYTVLVNSRSTEYKEENDVLVWLGTYDHTYGIIL